MDPGEDRAEDRWPVKVMVVARYEGRTHANSNHRSVGMLFFQLARSIFDVVEGSLPPRSKGGTVPGVEFGEPFGALVSIFQSRVASRSETRGR